MAEQRRIVYWDSCVFLSYINRYPDRIGDLDALLAESAKPGGNLEIVTSVYTVIEVAFALTEQTAKSLDPAVEDKIDKLWMDHKAIKLIDFYETTALLARGLVREAVRRGWKPNPKDAIHLATAQKFLVQELHTYDEEMDKYEPLIGIRICRPYLDQTQLGLG